MKNRTPLLVAFLLLLFTFSCVLAQKAYPEQSNVISLVGQPVNALHFGIDLPPSVINAAAGRTEQEDEEAVVDEALADTSLVMMPTALSDDEFSEEAEAMADSEAFLSSGAQLKATTMLNVRKGPCTNQRVIKVLRAGEKVSYNGVVRTGCGYTWYGVSGSFGSGFAAKAYLTSVSGGRQTQPKKPTQPKGGNTSRNGNSCRQSYNYPLFKQCDRRWGANRLGSSSTICKVGCLMTSVTSALNGRGKSSKNPGEMNAYLRAHGGYYGNLFVWGAVAKFGFKYLGQTTNKSTIRNWLCSGKVVVLNVNGGGHWVLAKSYSSGVYGVNDSGYNRSSYAESQVVRAAAFDV
ncbi:hypothetical protein C9374_001515 [Naegleria lovaniensis]|uniref:SH3b domain-containing protein n=1 Tax=Naegleria lovaniensis TaxID=51637 RepID=A0AA88GVQ1_NAELO|nr:uncharacterized protein C9374_001515 [Naegleria lovaniensis]KAG2387183.1 hypothetical protein C9374_001515 [Naegleria lovaniensis]